jgi:hypothetical protein
MYTIESIEDADSYDLDNESQVTEGIGQLTLDANQEVHFFGSSSGVHLLYEMKKADPHDSQLPIVRTLPIATDISEKHIDVHLPAIEIQNHLLDLYFAYIHPVFPVIHKASFLADYDFSKHSDKFTPDSPLSDSSGPKPERSRISKLLLLTMFASAACYIGHNNPLYSREKTLEFGHDYLKDARSMLRNAIFHSKTSTVQSLLLLSYREYGFGSIEQAWIFSGMQGISL